MAIWTPPCIADRIANSELHYCHWDPLKNLEFVLFVAIFGQCIPCILIILCYCKVFMVMRRQTKRIGSMFVKPAPSNTTHHSMAGPTMSTVDSTGVDRSKTANTEVENLRKNKPENRLSTISTGIETSITLPEPAISEQPRESSQNKERKIFVTLTYVLGSYLICWIPFYVVFCLSAWVPGSVPTWLFTLFFWTSYSNSTLNPFLYAYSNREFRKSFFGVIKFVYSCKWRK